MRSFVTSRSLPNISASSWPDISPFLREITTPRAKKVVKTVAIIDSFIRVEREAQTSAATKKIAHIEAPGII